MNYYSLARLNDAQKLALAPIVKGKTVYDLGAGALGMADAMVRLGAGHVVAVDKDYKDKFTNHLNNCSKWKSGSPRISLQAETFEEFEQSNKKPIRTALLSWPWASTFLGFSGDAALIRLLQNATHVIYIGKNFDGTHCGSNTLFNDFIQRHVVAHVPNRWNSLIIYGKRTSEPRELLPEERAVYSNEILWYEDFYDSEGQPLARSA